MIEIHVYDKYGYYLRTESHEDLDFTNSEGMRINLVPEDYTLIKPSPYFRSPKFVNGKWIDADSNEEQENIDETDIQKSTNEAFLKISNDLSTIKQSLIEISMTQLLSAMPSENLESIDLSSLVPTPESELEIDNKENKVDENPDNL